MIELGGQDAKIIVFKDDRGKRPEEEDSVDERQVRRRHRRGHRQDQRQAEDSRGRALGNQGYHGIKLHKVAGKCGVFAETDINGLQKEGTPPDELMASLFDAIVLQNLTRADARPHAAAARAAAGRAELLHPRHARSLAGQHPADVEGAQGRDSRGREARRTASRCPTTRSTSRRSARSNSARTKTMSVGRYRGSEQAGPLHRLRPRRRKRPASGGTGLVDIDRRARDVQDVNTAARNSLRRRSSGARRCAASSASTAGPLPPRPCCLSEEGDILCKAYQLSNGNPIQDTIEHVRGASQAGRGSGREARSAGRRHHRLRQGRSARMC